MSFPISSAGTKRDRTILIGGRSHRIADDHHEILLELQQGYFRYLTLQQLLFVTSMMGARVLRSVLNVTSIVGDNR